MNPRRRETVYARLGTRIYQGTAIADVNDLPAFGCPECGGELIQIRRRPIDRLLSAIVPVSRFRCSTMQCGYEGNLRN